MQSTCVKKSAVNIIKFCYKPKHFCDVTNIIFLTVNVSKIRCE